MLNGYLRECVVVIRENIADCVPEKQWRATKFQNEWTEVEGLFSGRATTKPDAPDCVSHFGNPAKSQMSAVCAVSTSVGFATPARTECAFIG